MKRLRDEKKNCAQSVVAFYAHKGGVGKTTSCLTMAVRALQKGLRVVVLDCDPQQNATAFLSQWKGEQRFAFEEDYRAMAENYRLRIKPIQERTVTDESSLASYALGHRNLFDLLRMTPRHTSIDDLWGSLPAIGYSVEQSLTVVAAHPMLSAYDNDLALEVHQRNFQPNYMARLGWFLEFLLARNDLVLLDLSPSNSFFNQMALASSSHFVLPLTGDKFSLQSLDTLDLMLQMAKSNFSYRLSRPAPQLLCVLYSQYEHGDALVRGFNDRDCRVAEHDYKQHLAIGVVFINRRQELSEYMLEQEQPRLVMVSEAREIYQKLGHSTLTVFDDVTLRAQQEEYDLLWKCIHTVLFPARKSWL